MLSWVFRLQADEVICLQLKCLLPAFRCNIYSLVLESQIGLLCCNTYCQNEQQINSGLSGQEPSRSVPLMPEGTGGAGHCKAHPLSHRSVTAFCKLLTPQLPFCIRETYGSSGRPCLSGERRTECGPTSTMTASLGMDATADVKSTLFL